MDKKYSERRHTPLDKELAKSENKLKEILFSDEDLDDDYDVDLDIDLDDYLDDTDLDRDFLSSLNDTSDDSSNGEPHHISFEGVVTVEPWLLDDDDFFRFYVTPDSSGTKSVYICPETINCEYVLKTGNKYEFICERSALGLKLVSFKPKPKLNNPRASVSSEDVIRDISSHIFELECHSKYEGPKFYIRLEGNIFDVRSKDFEINFSIKQGETVYACCLDREMSISADVSRFITKVENSNTQWTKIDGEAVKKSDVSGMYIVSGILANGTVYVENCSCGDAQSFVERYFPPEVHNEVIEAYTELSSRKKEEIENYIKGCTVHHTGTGVYNTSFASVSELKVKYQICRIFYPPEVQYAIEKTMADKSLKESQRSSILDVLINTKWGEKHCFNHDIKSIKQGLDATHYGMEHLKNELIKLVVSNSAKKSKKGMRLLLVGPPGVGKTSLVQSFAALYGIPFTKISLNGIDTPYFLKGTPRLYDNAIVGQIMRCIHRLGDNSMILLDELDKMSDTGKEGNPYSALYDLLDSDELFRDDMIECGVDLSDTIFVFTANDTANIPPAILDRMELLYVDDYSDTEKTQIASSYIIPKIMSRYGMNSSDILWQEGVIDILSNRYTLSNGVRDIEKNILRVVKTAVMWKKENNNEPLVVSTENITALLDIKKCRRNKVERTISGIKDKFIYFKNLYSPSVQKKVCSLLAEHDNARDTEKDVIRRRLASIVNILPAEKIITVDIPRILSCLNENHYGMSDVKKQILMQLVSRSLVKEKSSKCLLLNGMSGVGKTTLCQSLARALEIPFVKISLGGISAPENINGFEPTLHNAGPGVIVSNLADIGTCSAFILLDEIDKMVANGSKDPYSALLDLLDNSGGFNDSFCSVSLDLRDAFIVASSNTTNTIPTALLDRMEIIDVGGYTKEEKISIAAKSIIPKKLNMFNLSQALEFTKEAINSLVLDYCPSYGMRDVEKAVEKIISHLVYSNYQPTQKTRVTPELICKILGAKPLPRGNVSARMHPGTARALAVCGNRGTTFAVEVSENTYGDGDVITGLPQKSTLDSISIARLLASKYLQKKLPYLHIHFSEGGIEKDGPSAGITILAAILSGMLNISTGDTAFTGEIDIYGDIWAVGGIELKLSAADNEGCKKVFIPYDNYVQLCEDGKLQDYRCRIIPVKRVEEVIKELFSSSKRDNNAIKNKRR